MRKIFNKNLHIHIRVKEKCHPITIGLIVLVCLVSLVIVDSFKSVSAETFNLVTCEQAEVQTAIDGAVTGDVIILPAGECTWDTELKLNKGIELIGAGIDETTIINNVPSKAGSSGELLIEISSTEPWRLSSMTITDTGSNYDYQGHISIAAISNGWELDHVKFVDSNYRHMFIRKMSPGVIHDCVFQNSGNQAMNIRTADGRSEAEALWETETHIGGSDAIFIEDNIFSNSSSAKVAFDSEWGAKVVFRYNTLVNSFWLNHGCENGRSAIWLEAYNNTVTRTISSSSPAQTRRGGTGVSFNNTINYDGGQSTWREYVLNDYCSKGAVFYYTSGSQAPNIGDIIIGQTSGESGTVISVENPSSGSWGTGDAMGTLHLRPISGTSFLVDELINIQGGATNLMTVRYQPGSSRTTVYNCCEWYINNEHCTEYPCQDQVGRTYNQILEPIYNWNNRVNGVIDSMLVHDELDGEGGVFSCSDAIAENRDYYEGVSGIQTSNSSPFDGSSGVGWGLISNRPSTCTPGVAYWATDEGEWNSENAGSDGRLYKCTSVNNWTLYYTPYTYPHPIRAADGSTNNMLPAIFLLLILQ